MIVESYENNYEFVISKKVEYLPLFKRGMFGFFVWDFIREKSGCRSPPLINLFFKNFKLIGGRKMAKLPKRNKSKDNPYILDFDEENKMYTVEFVDNQKVIHNVEISIEIYEAFDKFELEDVSQIHKYRRHIEHSEIYEDTLNARALNKTLSVDEIVEKKIIIEELKNAIQELPDIQRNRLKKYYFDNKTFEEIAKEEKCTKRAVKFSVDIAIDKISKKLKK